MLLAIPMTDVKKGIKLSDIAGSCTLTKENWEKATKAFDIKSLYGLGVKHKKELLTAIKELEEEHDREARKTARPKRIKLENK